MSALAIELPEKALNDFCRRWKIRELAVFGSALRDDFRADSDVDFMASFADGAGWSLLDVIRAEDELAELVGRPVDLVERSTVEQSENWIRRNDILRTARVIYGG
jgi:predicted nucleotidyltransferase